ncbi:hypothetical protein [Pantoea septica]|uniref:hypothetical protein n=1 Tax=Pantoea septica TaxID=472695 RepID=UPI000534CE0F|nr:hypothetical protein [Pantoea septica]
MQDWFISWVCVCEVDKIIARGWDIRREYTITNAVDVARKYIEEVSNKHEVPADKIILMAMNKI